MAQLFEKFEAVTRNEVIQARKLGERYHKKIDRSGM